MKFNLIVPLFKSKANLPDLKIFLNHLSKDVNISQVIFVDDNCPEESGNEVAVIFKDFNFPIKVLFLQKNMGSFLAIREALIVAAENPSLVFSADQQESVETLIGLADQLCSNSDLVLGVRIKRDDPLIVKLFSNLFWRLFHKFVNPKFPRKGVDIFGLSHELKQKYVELSNPHQNMLSELINHADKISYLNYIRLKRKVGKSSWTFSKKLNYAGDTFFLNSKLPITILYFLSATGFIVSFVLILIVIFSYVSSLITIPNFVLIFMFMVLLSSFNFIFLAAAGSYMLRIQKLLLNPLPTVIKKNEM